MLYFSHLIICTVSCLPTSINNNVHALFFWPYHMHSAIYAYWYIQWCTRFILLTLSYVSCHIYQLVYTIMYMLYSSDIIICTMSCIPTSKYNNVHAFSSDLIICTVCCIPTSINNNLHALLFFSPYHMYSVMYVY